MRKIHELVGGRARVRERYAVLPAEGIPFSRLPEWQGVEVQVLASPALGAAFVEYLMAMPAGASGEHAADGEVEFFFYVLSGSLLLTVDGVEHTLAEGGFALVPPTNDFAALARTDARMLLLRKYYDWADGVEIYLPVVGNEKAVKGEVWGGDSGAILQTLIRDDLKYDLAMNIFTFEAGHGLPVTETHVMEHGLYVLQGKGLYFLGEQWMEVEATDFIWMGPYCPQSYYATGAVATKYLYYKDVNREISL